MKFSIENVVIHVQVIWLGKEINRLRDLQKTGWLVQRKQDPQIDIEIQALQNTKDVLSQYLRERAAAGGSEG